MAAGEEQGQQVAPADSRSDGAWSRGRQSERASAGRRRRPACRTRVTPRAAWSPQAVLRASAAGSWPPTPAASRRTAGRRLALALGAPLPIERRVGEHVRQAPRNRGIASSRSVCGSSRSSSGAKSRVTSYSTPKMASPVHNDGLRCTKCRLSCSASAISRCASASARSTLHRERRHGRRARGRPGEVARAAPASRRPPRRARRATNRASARRDRAEPVKVAVTGRRR